MRVRYQAAPHPENNKGQKYKSGWQNSNLPLNTLILLVLPFKNSTFSTILDTISIHIFYSNQLVKELTLKKFIKSNISVPI